MPWRSTAAIACAVSACVILASRLHAADDASLQLPAEQMPGAGAKFDPQPLVDQGLVGVHAVMDQVFPETVAEAAARRAQIAALVAQLGDDSYQRRTEAAASLRRLGSTCVGVLRQSINNNDAEIRLRVGELLAEFEQKSARESQSTNQALRAYLDKLADVDCRRELARRVAKALEARLDLTPKQDALKVCLEAVTRWPTNRVHDELLPLLKLEDPTPAMFAMHAISGRTGNNYVSAIHLGAIACGRPELVKCGFRSMPGPVWDEAAKPKIKAELEKLFDGSEVSAELSGDAKFMDLAAFVAARDYDIAGAHRWLHAHIEGSNDAAALDAMQSLSDTYYMRDALDPRLLAALEPHLKSANPRLRAAAVRTLGVYRGKAVQPLLMVAFADPDKLVWQAAGERLTDQHSYYQTGSSPIPKLLESAIEANKSPLHRARLSFLLKHLQSEKPGYLQWPD